MALPDELENPIHTLNQVGDLLDRYEAATGDEKVEVLREVLVKSCRFFEELHRDALLNQVDAVTVIYYPEAPGIKVQQTTLEMWNVLNDLDKSMHFFEQEAQLLTAADLNETTRNRVLQELRTVRRDTLRFLQQSKRVTTPEIAQRVERAANVLCSYKERELSSDLKHQRHAAALRRVNGALGVGALTVNAYGKLIHREALPPVVYDLSIQLGIQLAMKSVK